jgi:hypothetical protein
MSFTDFERKLLVAAYLLSEETGEDMIRAGDAITSYGIDHRPGWINRAVQGMISSGLSGDARTLAEELDQDIWLTAAGYRRAEELLPYFPLKRVGRVSVNLPATPTSVPASDRIVPLDHNNPMVSQAAADARKLAVALRESNDIGAISPEALPVAVEEVSQIAQALEQPAVRMPAFGERVRSTLGWIGKEAAGALVGAAALALLALLATILGIAF